MRQRAEVAAQHVAVEGVHDDRRPRVAGEQRGDAADRAGLRGVRVQDVRPLARGSAARGGRSASRSRIGEISRCRCGIVTTWTPSSSATYAIDCSPRATRAGDERRLVAALVEARGQVGDVQRRPAHVQAGDHAQDADAAQASRGASTVRRRPSSSSTVRLVAEHLARGASTSAHESRMSPGARRREAPLDRLAEDAADRVGDARSRSRACPRRR